MFNKVKLILYSDMVIINNYNSIEEIDNDIIKINNYVIKGNNLKIKEMDDFYILIKGIVKSVEILTSDRKNDKDK